MFHYLGRLVSIAFPRGLAYFRATFHQIWVRTGTVARRKGKVLMRKPWTYIVICVMCSALVTQAAPSKNIVVGINTENEGDLSQAGRDSEIELMQQNGVKTIRTALSSKSVDFIIEAYRHGIGTIVIIYPTWGSKAKSKRRWSDAPLSGADAQGFAAWFQEKLEKFEAAGVRLTGLELGCEINTSGYDSDIPRPGTGRVLGLSDLNNPRDPEGPAIANGYRNYLRVMEALKTVRDHSKVNKTTPIISASMADWGLPGPKSWNGDVGVSLPDAIQFLRQNGMDKLADGYGVHVYPTGNSHASVSDRVAELEKKKIFSECRQDKPCWLTEWGIGNSAKSCPFEDPRLPVIEAERSAFTKYIEEGRLTAVIYYVWSSSPRGLDPMSVFRCGSLSEAGKVAFSPL
jgi:hypothetical protein